MTSTRRTDFTDFVLDLLDFMEEKIHEATDNEASRAGAIAEAAGSVPLLRDCLSENEPVQAQFMLVFDTQMYDPHAAQWWFDLADVDRTEFERLAAGLVGPQGVLSALRKVAGAAGEPA